MWEKVRASSSSLVRESGLILKRISYSKLEDESPTPVEKSDNLDNEYIDGCEVIANVGSLERRDSDSSYESCNDDIAACYIKKCNKSNNNGDDADGIKIWNDIDSVDIIPIENDTNELNHSRIMNNVSVEYGCYRQRVSHGVDDYADAGFTRNAHPFWEQLYLRTSNGKSKTQPNEPQFYSSTATQESTSALEKEKLFSPTLNREFTSRSSVEMEAHGSQAIVKHVARMCADITSPDCEGNPISAAKVRDSETNVSRKGNFGWHNASHLESNLRNPFDKNKQPEEFRVVEPIKPCDVVACQSNGEIKEMSYNCNTGLRKHQETQITKCERAPEAQVRENKQRVTFAEIPVSISHVVVKRRSKCQQHPHSSSAQRENTRRHSIPRDVSLMVKREVTHAVNKVRPGTMKEYTKLDDSFEDVADEEDDDNDRNDHRSSIAWHQTFPAPNKSKQTGGTRRSRAKRKTRKACRWTGRTLWGGLKWLGRGVTYYATAPGGFANIFSVFGTSPYSPKL